MPFDNLLRQRAIERYRVSDEEVVGHLQAGKHDIDFASSIAGQDLDWAFTIAYNGILQTSLAFMYQRGYRPTGEAKHHNTFRFLAQALPHEYAARISLLQRLCAKRNRLLAEHLVFHLRAAWAPLTFADEAKDAPRKDAVAKARRGGAAEKKARTQKTAEGEVCYSFHTLLDHLATLMRNTIPLPAQGDATFEQLTRSTPLQREAFALLGVSVPLGPATCSRAASSSARARSSGSGRRPAASCSSPTCRRKGRWRTPPARRSPPTRAARHRAQLHLP